MNAVLKTEAVAIEAAAPLEMADPSKNLILVPLSQLLPRRSKRIQFKLYWRFFLCYCNHCRNCRCDLVG